MTNAKETIIKSALKYLVKRQIAEGSVGFAVDNDHDHDCCWDDVLAWIEAQPSEDCISRQAVLDIINFEDEWLFDAKSHNADTKIAFSAIKYKISELPSVTPERPKGKWIEVLEHRDEFGSTWHCECSECRARSYKGIEPLEKYCPNCGAEMSGGGEE